MANIVVTKNSDVITINYNDLASETVEKCSKMTFKNCNVISVKLLLDDRTQMKVNGDSICLCVNNVDTIEGSIPTDANDLYNKVINLL